MDNVNSKGTFVKSTSCGMFKPQINIQITIIVGLYLLFFLNSLYKFFVVLYIFLVL
jgi:hypothetical protein